MVPAIIAFSLGFPFGTTGAWFYFVSGEVLTLLGFSILKWKRAHKVSFSLDTYMDFKPEFGARTQNMLEFNIHSMEEVTSASESAQAFCVEQGQTEKTANFVALCVEEMAGNVIKHGFSKKKKNSLCVRIQNKNDRWVIRFRDDCRAFDPLHYVFKDGAPEVSGIRLMMSIADDARYTYSLNMNNLMLVVNNRAD